MLLGEFDPNAVVMWINKDYCKNGYAYMTSYNSKKASLSLVTTDVDEKEIDHYWESFLDTENITCKIIEEFKLEHRAGYVYPLKIENILFAGNAAGGVDPFLGFGHFNAITMGVSAARTIARGKDYEKQVDSIIKRNTQMLKLRKMFERLDNKGYDNLVGFLPLPGVKQILYHSNINISKYGAFISKFVF
ncbi:MAG: hypothetical protein MJA84_14235 [Firmicutes bacterium]|nr:hypothetical protein [Bacillota bacterium]